MKKTLLWILVLFGLLFIETCTSKVIEFYSTKSMNSIFAKDVKSLNLDMLTVVDKEKLSNDLYEFIKKNNDYVYVFSFNEANPFAIYSIPSTSSFSIIEGEQFTIGNEQEALVGIDYGKLNKQKIEDIGGKIQFRETDFLISGIIGTPNLVTDLNDAVILDADSLKNNTIPIEEVTEVVLANPENKKEFNKVFEEMKSTLEKNNVSYSNGSRVFGGEETDIKKYIETVLAQLIGIILIFVIVFFTLIEVQTKNERKHNSVLKLLGYNNKRIFGIRIKEKAVFMSKITIITIGVYFVMSQLFSQIFSKSNLYIIFGYVLTNIIIYVLMISVSILDISRREIRGDL